MDAKTLIAEFFGAPNRMTLEKFASKRGSWISTLRMERDRTALSFIAHLSPESRMVWYALGPPAMPAGELLELCRGFVGPSYAEQINLLDPARAVEAHERALTEFAVACSGAVARVDLGVLSADRVGDADRAAAAFELMENLIASRPPWSGYATRSLAQVLADLDLAFAEADVDGAEQLIVEIERSHSISEVNLQFLRIRMLQAVGRSAEVLENQRLGYLVHARRPRKVTRALLEAAHDVYLAGIALKREPLEEAGNHILMALGPAATELIDPGTAKEATALLAAGLAYGRGRKELAHIIEWLENHSEAADPVAAFFPSDITESPAEPKAPRAGADPLEAVAALIMEGRPVEALMLLRGQPASVRAARLAFQVDVLLNSRESAELLLTFGLEVHSDLDDRGDAKVIQRLDDLTAALPVVDTAAETKATSPIALPSSWQELLAHLESVDPRRSIRSLVELGASSWSADADSAVAIAEALTSLDTTKAAALRSVAGIIVEAHSELADVDAQLTLRAAMIELIAISDLPTTQELRAIVGWVETILSSATDQATVHRTLDALEVFVGEHPTPALAEALADLAAIVAYHPTAGERAPSFVLQVIEAIRSTGAGADRAVRATAARAAADVGAPLHQDDNFWPSGQKSEDWMGLLDGLHIGVHTLMGSVASRIRAELEPHIGSGSVTTNDDHVSTDSLRKLASNSDVMVLVTGAAKHTASQEIERLCPDAKLVRIASKGFSSLIRGLEAHLRARQAPPKAA
jgi:hypothetical protein